MIAYADFLMFPAGFLVSYGWPYKCLPDMGPATSLRPPLLRCLLQEMEEVVGAEPWLCLWRFKPVPPSVAW